MNRFNQQFEKLKSKPGFIAALDQSGGSTPRALALYGVEENSWQSEKKMFSIIHEMRTRIITSPCFTGKRILAAILFENTMDRFIEGVPAADYLWENRNIVPILKVDKGLQPEAGGVQLMKPIPVLDDTLGKAKSKHIFGTKMRSVIKLCSAEGIAAIATQQFELGKQIIASGLVPIIEPEVDIHSPEKVGIEELLLAEILKRLDSLGPDEIVMLKLTLPTEDNFYSECVAHPNVLRVVALSGGYTREEANTKLSRNTGMVASFSRALTEGLSIHQTDDEFNAMLGNSIESIYQASIK